MSVFRAGFATAVLLASLTITGCKPDSAPAAEHTVVALVTPKPAGPYGVGVGQRDDKWLIYYPAPVSTAMHPAVAIPAEHAADLTRRFGPDAARALTTGKGYAVANTRPEPGAWPVIIFAPGWHMMSQDYRALLEDVASRGYIVIASEALPESGKPPYAATADRLAAGRRLATRIAADPLDNLNRVIDSRHVIMAGHSVGGAAAVLAADRDPSLSGAINLDGDYADEAATAQPRTPVLYLLSVTPDEAARSVGRRTKVWRDVSARSAAPMALQVQGFGHLNFLDAALVSEQMPVKQRSVSFGYYIPAAGLRLTGDLVAAFCDEQIKGKAGALAAARARWPDAAPYQP